MVPVLLKVVTENDSSVNGASRDFQVVVAALGRVTGKVITGCYICTREFADGLHEFEACFAAREIATIKENVRTFSQRILPLGDLTS